MRDRSVVGGRRSAGALTVLVLAMIAIGCSQQNASPRTADSVAGPERSRVDRGGGSADAAPVSTARRTVLFVGTSLTAGLGLEPDSAYPMMVARRIDGAGLPYAVVNAGVSGETTAGLLARLDWLLRRKADVVVVESGANDGLRGVPVATMRENLDQVLRRVKAAQPQAVVLLVQMEAPPNMGAAYTREFRDVYPALARAHGIALLPFLLEGVAGHPELNQPDGIHPNLRGERMVAENVWKGLEPVLRAGTTR